MNPPGVEDCPSPMTHESYQAVVVSGVVGTVVVVGGGVGVVGIIVDLNFINLCCRRRRIRAILSLLFWSGFSPEFCECPLFAVTTFLLPLRMTGYCTLLLPLLSRRIGLLPCRAIICGQIKKSSHHLRQSYCTNMDGAVGSRWHRLTALIRSQFDFAKLKLQAVAPDW